MIRALLVRRFLPLFIAAIFLILHVWACSPGNRLGKRVVSIPSIENATNVGNESCVMCHTECEGQFQKTPHGRVMSFETAAVGMEMSCEVCHGAGSIHAETESPDDILILGKLDRAASSSICLQCHNKGSLMDWRGNEHDMNGVGCLDCHMVHKISSARHQLIRSDPQVCYTCHQEQQIETMLPSHHPIPEGKMACGDCHRPHGAFEGSLDSDESVNDMCLNCHAQYQGPFIFEHEPVLESCLLCHAPHGAVANNLLTQNEPFICLQCHDFHFHAGLEGFDGTWTDIFGRPGSTDRNSNQVAFTTSCTQCHSEIHGSDLPSQGVTGGGRALTR